MVTNCFRYPCVLLSIQDPSPEIRVEYSLDDSFKQNLSFLGPKGTHYEGGTFFIEMTFPYNFPFKPPTLRFNTKVYHTQVDPSGKITGLEILDNWNPGMSVKDIMLAVIDMMRNPKTMPHFNMQVSRQFYEDRPMYDYNCMHYTEKYAK